MLYKFKSKVTSDVIMLEPNGREILQIIGKFATENPYKGIIEPDYMPFAIAALEQALAKVQQIVASPNVNNDASEKVNDVEAVQLHQRAAPFLDMLKRSLAKQQPIVWGV